MATRLAQGGRLIDRSRTFKLRFNGKEMKAFAGDTLASALLANDQLLVGRSFKYHRPRGTVTSGPEEPNALVSVGTGGKFEPNQRATVVEVFDGLEAASQNHWPSLEFDVGSTADLLSGLLPAGFYYKTFIWPRTAWAKLYEPVIRRAAGLGRPPIERDPDNYEHCHVHVDAVIVGGGIAGILAADRLARAGAEVLVVEQTAGWGGRSKNDLGEIDGTPAADWLEGSIRQLEERDNVHLLTRTTGIGVYDHGYLLALERVSENNVSGLGVRHRLWRIRARKILLAAGAIERPICFKGNDVPGVMLASAVRDYVHDFGVSPGDRTVLLTNNDDAYKSAFALAEAGLSVPAILDVRPESDGPAAAKARAMGIPLETGKAISAVWGRSRVSGIAVCAQAGEGTILKEIDCDCVAVSGGWSPSVHLWSHCGGRVRWDSEQVMFRPDHRSPPLGDDGDALVRPVGAANGMLSAAEAVQDGASAATETIIEFGLPDTDSALPVVESVSERRIVPAWFVPNGMGSSAKRKSWVDFQNDVKVSDIELAAREGYESAEHAKRYTTLGMATDQGKLSNLNGVAVLSRALSLGECEAGTTTFRPPYTPVALGAIAGDARGILFKPVRKTPMDKWHDRNGAFWEPVGDWRRPYCYLESADETVEQAVARETLAVRKSVGILDATTLGKILVKGRDAGRFLDMLYTNMMSSLRPGFCRYGLMCNENGFLMDDGVVARIDGETFLCHTTTGGADHVHSWMEEWLQCEWWDWEVYTANLTEAYAQIGVAGPEARHVLQTLGGFDLGAASLPFMSWKEGQIGGFDVKVYRISFSGEISFELSVPAGQGTDLWKAIIEAGEAHGITPYGTEALHVLRAEKGYIMIGDETDGTVTPQDLGLGWAISKKKPDYLGKRAQERLHLVDPNRWKLVGLKTVGGSDKLPCGSHAVGEGRNMHGHRKLIGRVTSSYFSPILNRTIAMGLIERGPERMGEVIDFTTTAGTVKARVTSPVFYDPEGTQLNA